MRTLYGWRFLLTIVLPLLLAWLGVGQLTSELVTLVSTGANTEDHNRTLQTINAALNGTQREISNVTIDNAYWDDAAFNAYVAIDANWFEETWGFATGQGVNYDMALVLDVDQPNIVAGARQGKPFTPAWRDYFGQKIESSINLLLKEPRAKQSEAGIVRTEDGLAVYAVAPILPTTEGVAIPAEKPRFLMLAKYLTPERVAAIGQQYVIADLTMTPVEGGSAAGDYYKDESGPVALLRWTDRRPGDVVSAAVSGKALAVLAFLGLVMIGIALVCWRLIHSLGEKEAAARNEALHDALTGLPNRAALYAYINRLAEAGERVAVAFADLDGFKEVNDTYDHDTGDQLIKVAASALANIAGGQGTTYRMGGDEFVIMMTGEGAEKSLRRVATDFIAMLVAPFVIEGKIARVGASIGIAQAAAVDASEIMRRADIAMYEAKRQGKNRVCVYDESSDAERRETLAIGEELRGFVADGGIEIAYQPIVDASGSRIVGVEALARWPASSARRIGPDRFIRIAETSGFIDDLGNAILANACAAALAWSGVRLAVNISPVQLRNPHFVASTLRTIRKSGMDCANVELEITESELLGDVAGVQRIFAELRASGIRVALDDFGAGFSSIGNLRQFNFDFVKIDRSLIDKVEMGESERDIVRGVMLLAAGISAIVTAEGVETAGQLGFLREIGCTEMQGYHFYKPLPADEIGRLLSIPSAAPPVPAVS